MSAITQRDVILALQVQGFPLAEIEVWFAERDARLTGARVKLRDQLAAAALTGVIATLINPAENDAAVHISAERNIPVAALAAEKAYEYADALLAAREAKAG